MLHLLLSVKAGLQERTWAWTLEGRELVWVMGWVVVDEDLVLEQVQVLDPLVAIPVHHLLHLGRVMVLVLG